MLLNKQSRPASRTDRRVLTQRGKGVVTVDGAGQIAHSRTVSKGSFVTVHQETYTTFGACPSSKNGFQLHRSIWPTCGIQKLHWALQCEAIQAMSLKQLVRFQARLAKVASHLTSFSLAFALSQEVVHGVEKRAIQMAYRRVRIHVS
jgi:hypothetical protein